MSTTLVMQFLMKKKKQSFLIIGLRLDLEKIFQYIGDVKPISFVDMPLLMARDENGEINVFPEYMPPSWDDFN